MWYAGHHTIKNSHTFEKLCSQISGVRKFTCSQLGGGKKIENIQGSLLGDLLEGGNLDDSSLSCTFKVTKVRRNFTSSKIKIFN